MKPETRTMHQLLGDITRAMGDPDTPADDFDHLGAAVRRRGSQLAKDLEAIAVSRRAGRSRARSAA